ncbi:MAG: hypothetical protein WBV28_13145 [Terracidiphilus sp.]
MPSQRAREASIDVRPAGKSTIRRQRPGGVDKRDVEQGLREVPHESTMSWIVLFAE